MNTPYVIIDDSFQKCWIEAVKCLKSNHWELFNLIVQIRDPMLYYHDIDNKIVSFAKSINILTPKHVAYTIFPHGFYKGRGTADKLYRFYKRKSPRLIRKSNNKWGTYFQRMISYKRGENTINQLQNIIDAINTRKFIYKAAYTIVIEEPGKETIRIMGAPCLNYLSFQLQSGLTRKIGLLCTYRNHDFLERSYGNYWGLCNLLKFIAEETNSTPGPITCISSHAYINKEKNKLSQLLRLFS